MKTEIKDGIKVEIKDRKFKSYVKRTYTAKLKIGKKLYPVKQHDYIYENREVGDDIQQKTYWAKIWYVTTSQMKSILLNNEVEVKMTGYFDGMQDMQVCTNKGEFKKPSPEYLKDIISDLERKGLMRVRYDMEEDIFELWSCCNDYKIWVKDMEGFQ